jgi:hypothetical protein
MLFWFRFSLFAFRFSLFAFYGSGLAPLPLFPPRTPINFFYRASKKRRGEAKKRKETKRSKKKLPKN